MPTLDQTRISLEGALGLREAKSTSERLARAIAQYDVIELDVSGLTSLDISIAQLLIAARKSADRRGKTITILDGSSGPWRDVISQAGLLGSGGVSRTAEEEFWLGEMRAERHVA